MFKTHFSSQKAFVLSGILASVAIFSAPLGAIAADLSLAGAPHASDIQPEIAKKVAPEKELKSNLSDAETQVKEAETALKQVVADHNNDQASADDVSTHIQALSDNISALNDQIKKIEAAPKSKVHSKWIKEGKAINAAANKLLNSAQQNA